MKTNFLYILKKEIKMKDNSTLTDLYRVIIKDSTKVPSFLNKKDPIHLDVYAIIGELTRELSELVKSIVMSDRKVFEFCVGFEAIAQQFDEIKSFTLYLTVIDYINGLIKKYWEISIENEDYEVSENFKKFCEYRDSYSTYQKK